MAYTQCDCPFLAQRSFERTVDEKANKTWVETIWSQVETLNDQIKSMALDIVNLNKNIETASSLWTNWKD